MAKKPESRPGVQADALSQAEPPQALTRCECGRHFSVEHWRRLQFAGAQPLGFADVAVEQRICDGCGATVGLTVHLVPCAVARLSDRLGRDAP